MRIKNVGLCSLLAAQPRVNQPTVAWPCVLLAPKSARPQGRSKIDTPYPKGLGEDASYWFRQHPKCALYVRDYSNEPVMNVWFK